jgi:TrmH family RNA methyltransferase
VATAAADLGHLHIVLVRTQLASNVGTVARAIANFGLGRLRLVDPQGFDPEVARWLAPGVGHIIDQALICVDVEEAVADCRRVVGTTSRPRRWDWPCWGPAELIAQERRLPTDTALLFGPEDAGLSNADLLRCDAMLTLPTAAHASLNLGQAVTVVGALLRDAALEQPAAPLRREAAPLRLRTELVELCLGALDQIGYTRSRSADQLRSTLQRLLGRAEADEREVSALMGMVRQLRRQLPREPPPGR